MISFKELCEDNSFNEKCGNVKKIAYMFLGNPMQIVVNESYFSGINYERSFWTDHGIKHSKRVLEIIQKLLIKNPLKKNLSKKELFYLCSSVWLHDLGMYVKDPDFNTAVDHRKYHGRISGRILRRLFELSNSDFKDIPNPWDKIQELNITIVLCEAHQSNINLNNIKYISDNGDTIRVSLLAAFLALADALDINKERAPESFFEFFETYFSQPSEMSQFEWVVNQCVENEKISVINIPKRLVDKYMTLLKRSLRKIHDTQKEAGMEKLRYYIYNYINFYIEKHVKQVNVRNVKKHFKNNGLIKIPNSIFTPIKKNRNCKSYKEFECVWPDYFERHDIPAVVSKKIDQIKNDAKVSFDDFYIFIFDKLSFSITYWNAPNL